MPAKASFTVIMSSILAGCWRLFRHALSKQNNADSVQQTCAKGRHCHDSVLRESAAAIETQSLVPTSLDLASVETSSAHAQLPQQLLQLTHCLLRPQPDLKSLQRQLLLMVPTTTCCSALTEHTAQSTQNLKLIQPFMLRQLSQTSSYLSTPVMRPACSAFHLRLKLQAALQQPKRALVFTRAWMHKSILQKHWCVSI